MRNIVLLPTLPAMPSACSLVGLPAEFSSSVSWQFFTCFFVHKSQTLTRLCLPKARFGQRTSWKSSKSFVTLTHSHIASIEWFIESWANRIMYKEKRLESTMVVCDPCIYTVDTFYRRNLTTNRTRTLPYKSSDVIKYGVVAFFDEWIVQLFVTQSWHNYSEIFRDHRHEAWLDTSDIIRWNQ